ncbi:CAP domain-containing protein [Actinoplanes sp. NPDC023801]|uniref:CAP domain-containing protein n=1 Tax=Actinoplanes sp. NPDC023801 TaxID=3154595 RepID=UPI003401E3D8
MIASPAGAVQAKSGPSQPASWTPGPPQYGSWKSDFRRPGPGKRGPSWRGPAWPAPAQPAPAMPAPAMPAPAMPAPARPAPTMPAPTMPAPAAPAPATPAPTRPTPTTPAPATPAPTTPAPAGSVPASSTEQALQNEINRLVNVQRSNNGCTALTVNDQLTAAARSHSAWMAQTGTLSHTGSGGSTFVTRVKAAGYAQPSAENIAMGYRTAAEVVNGWMNSSGHRTNILNCQSKAVGVGVVYAAGGAPYYTQNFGY